MIVFQIKAVFRLNISMDPSRSEDLQIKIQTLQIYEPQSVVETNHRIRLYPQFIAPLVTRKLGYFTGGTLQVARPITLQSHEEAVVVRGVSFNQS